MERKPVDLGAYAAADETVPVIDLADLLCGPAGNCSGLRRIGDKWVGRCPLPDHSAKVPSFVVWPETNSWWCYGCSRGGGILDLKRLAGGDPR